MSSAPGFAAPLDELTLARLRRGDAEAFATVYRRYGTPAYTLALRLTGRGDAAEDVVQEVFLKVLERVDGYRGEAPFGGWLRRLVANAAIDRLRQECRWAEQALPEQVAIDAERPDVQHDALGLLARLSPSARAVVVLHEIEGYSHLELARLLGRSESYSKSLLSRALARLRHWLRAEQPALEHTA